MLLKDNINNGTLDIPVSVGDWSGLPLDSALSFKPSRSTAVAGFGLLAAAAVALAGAGLMEESTADTSPDRGLPKPGLLSRNLFCVLVRRRLVAS